MILDYDSQAKPQSTLNRALSIIIFLGVGIAVVALLVNRGAEKKENYLANGTPINLYTHYKNISDNKYQITTWKGQPEFEEYILSSSIIVKAEYVSEEIQEPEQRLFEMRIVELVSCSDSSISIGDIIKVKGDIAQEENFSYSIADQTILSLQKQDDGVYFPKNDMMGVFYVVDEKVYPACDIYDFANYIGMKESKFIKKLNRIAN